MIKYRLQSSIRSVDSETNCQSSNITSVTIYMTLGKLINIIVPRFLILLDMVILVPTS